MVPAILLLAALKVVIGVVSSAGQELMLPAGPSVIPPAVFVAAIAVFGVAAGWLILGGRSDRRSVYLGLAYLLTAAAFSDGLLGTALAAGPGPVLAAAYSAGRSFPIEGFLPFALWLFAREFPRTASFARSFRLASAMVWVTGTTGALLAVANLLVVLGPGERLGFGLLAPNAYGVFWTVVFLLTLPALPFIAWKARRSELDERRRVRLFVAGLVIGLGPLVLEVLLEGLIPPYARFMERPLPLLVGGLILYPLLFSIPFTTAYSVIVHRALAVKLIVRRALQYLLARYSVIALAALPLAGLVLYVYERREQPVGALLTGGQGIVLVTASALALIALRVRKPLLEWIDRRFFREQYDARKILAELVRQSRTAESPDRLMERLETGIDQALHLQSIAVLRHDRAWGTFVAQAGHVRPLPADSPLATLVAGSAEPLKIDLASPSSPLARLPESDRQWLADGAFVLLVPLLASTGSPLGLIALGEKKSELPFSAEDHSLLVDIAVSGSLALENLTMLSSAGLRESVDGAPVSDADAAAALADECLRCHLVFAPGSAECQVCGQTLIGSTVPYVIAGKFRLERRLGAGGMGVVYRASDLVLGRQVAIKTLPRLSPERSLRMRREARAMAAVSHPNLALIFGAESWRGTPMLICELLEGGTLDDRLESRRLGVLEALELGIDLAGGIEALHRAGILHRDIKPSNIGFTRDNLVKLLDFGLVRIVTEPDDEPGSGDLEDLDSKIREGDTLTMIVKTADGRVVGTPLYMSPEASVGAEPDPGFDLWGLSMVLYEALSGIHPFVASDVRQTLRRIRAGGIPELDEVRPDCPVPVAEFFARALHADPARRPGSARELKRRLEALRETALVAA